MDNYLEKLLTELGVVIEEAIQDSEAVNKVMERIHATGNEVFLAVEATISVREQPPQESLPFREIPIEDRIKEISQEDRQFLRNLKIKFDHDE